MFFSFRSLSIHSRWLLTLVTQKWNHFDFSEALRYIEMVIMLTRTFVILLITRDLKITLKFKQITAICIILKTADAYKIQTVWFARLFFACKTKNPLHNFLESDEWRLDWQMALLTNIFNSIFQRKKFFRRSQSFARNWRPIKRKIEKEK